MKHIFAVQGSSPNPYVIEIEYSDTEFIATCDCQLAAFRKDKYLCKHLTPILKGNVPIGLVNGDKQAIPMISKAFQTTEVGKLYQNFLELEQLVTEKDKEMKATKKLVAKILYQFD